jgi:hypothetical protein
MPAGCQRSDKRERHGTPPSLVASADVRQEEKIKTAGLETSVPIRGDAMERHHLPTHCVAGICDLVASADVRQEEKIKTAGLETSVPIRGDAMERHHPWWHRRTCGRKKR